MKTREWMPICFCLLVITGVNLNLDFYQNTIHPLNLTTENLNQVIGSSSISQIKTHLAETKHNINTVMEKMSEDKNPVWLYPTESTNFLRIENDLDSMIISIDKLSELSTDTSAFHTGMLDISNRASLVKENLSDARGFLYGSITNAFFTLIWLTGIIGLAKLQIQK